MQRNLIFLILPILCLTLTACVNHTYASADFVVHSFTSDSSDNESSIFNYLNIIDYQDETAAVEFNASLYDNTDQAFIYIDVEEDMSVTINYTYTTDNNSTADLTYTSENQSSINSIKLSAATEEAYNFIWSTEEITLKKGVNIFYISGDQCSCKMLMEINGIDKANIKYLGISPQS